MKKENKFKSISLILPAYNEEENIKEAVENATKVLEKIFDEYEIIVVDDGSNDKTGEIADSLKSEKIKVIHHEINRGYASALRTGIKNATKELVFYTDADNQFDLNELRKAVNLLDGDKGKFDVVIGYRKDRRDRLHRLIISKGYNLLIRFLLGIRVKDADCSFKLFKRDVIKGIEIKHEGWLVDTEILAKIIRKGYKIKEIPVKHYPRKKGKSSVKITSILKTFFELIKLKIELSLLQKE